MLVSIIFMFTLKCFPCFCQRQKMFHLISQQTFSTVVLKTRTYALLPYDELRVCWFFYRNLFHVLIFFFRYVSLLLCFVGFQMIQKQVELVLL